MIQVTIGNSSSRIIGLNVTQTKELKKLLSYTVGSYASRFGPRHVSLLSKRGDFATGLYIHVKTYLTKNLIVFKVLDTRVKPPVKSTLHLNLDFDPYPDQIAAVEAAGKAHRGTIVMPTGTGKSLVIALIAARLGETTLVVVPSLEIKKQLKASLDEILGPNHQVDVENIDSSALKDPKKYNCLIIDEAHHGAAKTYQKLNKTQWTGIYYRYSLTATPFRNNTEETLLFQSLAGQVIYQLSYIESVVRGYIVPVDSFYMDVPSKVTESYTYAEVYSELIVNNGPRNTIIANLLKTLQENSIYTLCLVKEVAHGRILAELTGIPFATGADQDSRAYIDQFKTGDIVCLIGTEAILGEGVDTKPCEYVIIAGLGKAKSSFMQRVGRAVRNYLGKESAKVIIFKDISHRFTLRHFKEQVKILKQEYGSKPMRLL